MKIQNKIVDGDGNIRVLIKGLKKSTKLNEIARRYSKNYKLPGYIPANMSKDGLMLIKRNKPLRTTFSWRQWERK